MPDPVLYLQALLAAAGTSASCLLALRWSRWEVSRTRINAACVLGIGLGLTMACWLLDVRPAWPPANGLDRLLLIVLPAAFAIELLAGSERVPRWLVWLLRTTLAVQIGRILLHGSVYLSGENPAWTTWQAVGVFAGLSLVLTTEWVLLAWLQDRSPNASLPLSLSLAILCTGCAVMLAGYRTGGEAALTLAAALTGAALAAGPIHQRTLTPGAIGIGIVGLSGLLMIGRFFGNLSTGPALTLFLAPLVCWATELPPLRHRNPWLIAAVRLSLVAIPLLVVLALAKLEFDRHTAPLLGLNR